MNSYEKHSQIADLVKSPNAKNWKVNVFAFSACSGPLGMQSGKIKDSQLTASSKWGNISYWAVVNGRLNSGGFWAPDAGYGQWLQIAFERETAVMKVATQGSVAKNYWVRDYKISSTKDQATWNFIMENGANKVRRVTHWPVNRKGAGWFNPSTPKFKRYILPTFLKRNVWAR